MSIEDRDILMLRLERSGILVQGYTFERADPNDRGVVAYQIRDARGRAVATVSVGP